MKILLVVYDNESFIHKFPIGLAYIAAILEKSGHDITIYSQDKNHYPEEHLTQYLDNNEYDIVGVSIIAGYYQYRKLLKLSDAINRSRRRPLYIIGGHGPSPEPEFFFRKTQADVIVIGEGEKTIIELLNALKDKRPLKDIKGIAFREGGKTIINERQPLLKDIDSIPFPAYHLFPMDYYRLIREPHVFITDFAMPMLSGRGCTFKCNFCYRMDDGFRPRSNEGIVEEIRLLKKDYGVTYISFYDELLMSSKERTLSLCESLIKANVNVKWFCNGRLNYATKEVLRLMQKAGCVFVNYGIEAMDDEVLKNMKKGLTTGQIIKGVEATLDVGISPGFNVIFGNIGDTEESLNEGVDFLLKYDDGAQMRTIRPVTPYPGSPLYYDAIKKGLLKDCEDFYESKHTNSDLLTINFTELSDDEFYRCLFKANRRLLENYFQKRLASTIGDAEALYLHRNASFRGFRQS